MPKVSVIIPNYNHALFLNERIDSVLNQTFQDFEVIILDDCSTDNSKEVIEEYRNHPKISQIIYNELNSGSTFKQWKKGIDLAKGEWIWIAESDDWCDKNFLEVLTRELSNDLSIVFCQSITHLPGNLQLIKQDLHPSVIDIKSNEFINNYIVKGNSIYNASMAIFNKSYYLKIESDSYTSYTFCGDWIFWSELANLGDVRRYNNLLNNFRKTGKSDVTSKTFLNGKNLIEDVNALNYFHLKYDCDNSIYLNELKKYFNRYKKSTLNIEIEKTILKNFIDKLGRKRIFIWEMKYYKNKIIDFIYRKFK